MSRTFSSVACNLDANLLLASLPLFESGRVEALEWSFDALFHVRQMPPWFSELLKAFSEEGRLVGHGVFFSLFSGKWSEGQQAWLSHLKKLSAEFRFDHVTEHFGFMTGEDFHKGAPLGVPFNSTTLAIGRDRLKRIQEACRCPVGLENLAFSCSLDEVKKHGEFLAELIEPVNGFIILDLHNLYCQLHNFNIEFEEIIGLYPLDRVREIHISGGSWDDSAIVPGKKTRRDTHDDAVPAEVFQLLELAAGLCPNLKYVVLEQLGSALDTEESRRLFQQDFYKMEQAIKGRNSPQGNSFLPETPLEFGSPLEDAQLYFQQMELSKILESAVGCEEARQLLAGSSLSNSDWQVEKWEPCMLEAALRIAQKWKHGWTADGGRRTVDGGSVHRPPSTVRRPKMLSRLSAFLLRLLGWKIEGRYPVELPKVVLIVIPHTSNWDFPLGLLVRSAIRGDIVFVGKASLFRPPFGRVFRWLGGYPVERGRSTNFVQEMVGIFNREPRFHVVMSPEGTRSKVEKLKTGFYHIALGAGAPIVMCRFDWRRRVVEFREPFHPASDQAADFQVIDDWFKGVEGKRPERGYLYKS